MPSIAEQNLAAALPSLFDVHGNATLKYFGPTPSETGLFYMTHAQMARLTDEEMFALVDDGGVTLTAIANDKLPQIEEGDHDRKRKWIKEVTIAADPDGPYGGVADMSHGGKILLNDQWWEVVDGSLIEGDAVHTFDVVRFARLAIRLGSSGR
jgi:hypothetical protein